MKMHFNYKDLVKAPRMAFSFKMIWIGLVGLLASWGVFQVFLFLATLVSGKSFPEAHYMLPAMQGGSLLSGFNTIGILFFILGVIAVVCIMFLTYVAMARAAYMNLREELFYSWLDSYKWALKKWISILGTYFTFFILLLMFIIGAIVMAYIGKIPYIGSFITALLSIPYVLAGMLVVYIFIGFIVSLIYAPSIIASYDEDALGAVFQSFSSLASQPFRTFWYAFLTRILNLIFTALYSLGLIAGLAVFLKLFEIAMGSDIITLFKASLGLALKILGGPVPFLLQQYIFPAGEPAFIPTLIFAISLFILILSISAYSIALTISGYTISYVIIEKLKDDENLLERKDEEVDEDEEDDDEDESDDLNEEDGEEEEAESEEEDEQNDDEDDINTDGTSGDESAKN